MAKVAGGRAGVALEGVVMEMAEEGKVREEAGKAVGKAVVAEREGSWEARSVRAASVVEARGEGVKAEVPKGEEAQVEVARASEDRAAGGMAEGVRGEAARERAGAVMAMEAGVKGLVAVGMAEGAVMETEAAEKARVVAARAAAAAVMAMAAVVTEGGARVMGAAGMAEAMVEAQQR